MKKKKSYVLNFIKDFVFLIYRAKIFSVNCYKKHSKLRPFLVTRRWVVNQRWMNGHSMVNQRRFIRYAQRRADLDTKYKNTKYKEYWYWCTNKKHYQHHRFSWINRRYFPFTGLAWEDRTANGSLHIDRKSVV